MQAKRVKRQTAALWASPIGKRERGQLWISCLYCRLLFRVCRPIQMVPTRLNRRAGRQIGVRVGCSCASVQQLTGDVAATPPRMIRVGPGATHRAAPPLHRSRHSTSVRGQCDHCDGTTVKGKY